MSARYIQAILAIALSIQSNITVAQETPQKSIVAIVGDTDRFNIGQTGFCGDRTDITSPTGKQFRIPSDKKTFFFIQSKIHAQMATYTCEGEYSFTPTSGLLHLIRYTMNNDHCMLEMYQSEPGGSPTPIDFTREEKRSCLLN